MEWEVLFDATVAVRVEAESQDEAEDLARGRVEEYLEGAVKAELSVSDLYCIVNKSTGEEILM